MRGMPPSKMEQIPNTCDAGQIEGGPASAVSMGAQFKPSVQGSRKSRTCVHPAHSLASASSAECGDEIKVIKEVIDAIVVEVGGAERR